MTGTQYKEEWAAPEPSAHAVSRRVVRAELFRAFGGKYDWALIELSILFGQTSGRTEALFIPDDASFTNPRTIKGSLAGASQWGPPLLHGLPAEYVDDGVAFMIRREATKTIGNAHVTVLNAGYSLEGSSVMAFRATTFLAMHAALLNPSEKSDRDLENSIRQILGNPHDTGTAK